MSATDLDQTMEAASSYAEEIALPDFASTAIARAIAVAEQNRLTIEAATTPENVAFTLRRLVEAAAPIEEDGGSAADREAFSEAFQDACFVVAWLEGEGA